MSIIGQGAKIKRAIIGEGAEGGRNRCIRESICCRIQTRKWGTKR